MGTRRRSVPALCSYSAPHRRQGNHTGVATRFSVAKANGLHDNRSCRRCPSASTVVTFVITWLPQGSALGTKSSYLRTCQALPCYLVLHGTIRSACHSGIHPHLPQRRCDAYTLPSPVATVADGCTVPVTRSALAFGVAHTRLSAVPQLPRYSSRPGGWNLRCRRGTALWATALF